MSTQGQVWLHEFKLGVAVGTFYGCFVIGVRWFEWNFLRLLGVRDLNNISLGFTVEMLVLWGFVAPLVISVLLAAFRSLISDPKLTDVS